MSQSVRNVFRDVPYYSQNIWLYKLFELKFSGKTSEEKYAASLGTNPKQIFLNICDYFKKICQKHRDSHSHIERTVNVRGEGPTKITISNASIDKRVTIFTKLKKNGSRKRGFRRFITHTILF